jgi:hypothetical protein
MLCCALGDLMLVMEMDMPVLLLDCGPTCMTSPRLPGLLHIFGVWDPISLFTE